MSRARFAYNFCAQYFSSQFWNERMIHYGKLNNDKVFYLIRRRDKTVGLFSIYTYALGHVKYALSKGWIPVIDFQNYQNTYLEPNKAGIENSWEYFFNQPTNYNLYDVYKSKNVVLSSSSASLDMPTISMDFFNNHESIRYWRNLAKRYLGIKNDILDCIEDEWNQMFETYDPREVLGVLLRGSDYISLKPTNHPVQPSVDEAIYEIHRLEKLYGTKHIYLATEDSYILEKLKDEFGDKLKYSFSKRYEHKVDRLLYKIDNNNLYLKGKNYIKSIGVLSKCKYFWGGRTSGSVALMLISDGFEQFSVWDRGLY